MTSPKKELTNKYYNPELSTLLDYEIGEGNTIHTHTWIGNNVKIGNNCKIQAFCFIPDGVELEDNVFLGPHVCFTNDKYPPSGNWSKTLVKKGASIGANCTILPGITIGEDVKVGAGSVITKDLLKKGTYFGNPAKKYD